MEAAEACTVELCARNSRLYFYGLMRELCNLVDVSEGNLQPAQVARLGELLSMIEETARVGHKALYRAIHEHSEA